MRILIDVQTLYTNEKNRGIGIYTYNWVKQIVQEDPSTRFFLFRKVENEWEFTFFSSHLSLDERLNHDQYWEKHDLEHFISEHSIDLVQFTSPLMFDIDIPIIKQKNVLISYLVYDLIPIAMRKEYYDQWPATIKREYDERCERIRKADLVLTISQASKSDLIKFLKIAENKIEVIYASTNESLYTASRTGLESEILKQDLLLDTPFIYSLTGYDVRKNNKGLIEAFSNISKEFPELKMVISGIRNANEQQEFLNFVKSISGPTEKIVFMGFLSEEALLSLYKMCEFFVFPSYYEGFGLPVLEAMRVGAATITTNVSSIPEVTGDAAILVNPQDHKDLQDAMKAILTDEQLKKTLQKKSIERSRAFSWKKVGTLSFESIQRLIFNKINISPNSKPSKPELAYFSPLNPQVSGISDYSEELLVYLKEYYDIKVFVNGFTPSNPSIISEFEVIELEGNRSRLECMHTRIYHIGNNELHEWILKTLVSYPGTVLLHDLNLFGFINYITAGRGNKEELARELIYAYGSEGTDAAKEFIMHGTYPSSQRFPLFNKIVELSNGIIVHSNWVKQQIHQTLSFSGPIQVIPHGFKFEKETETQIAVRERLKLDPSRLIIGVFGSIVPNKRIAVILQVFKRLIQTNPTVQLLIAGYADKQAKQELLQQAKTLGLKEQLIIELSPAIDKFKDLIKSTDICINLRWPSMGETSGALTRALGAGIPCIVSDIASYSEYPDDCVWKVDVGEIEEEMLLAYLLELTNNKGIRTEMKKYALDYMKSCNFEIVAKRLHNFLS